MFYAVFQVIPYFRIVELAVGDNTSTVAAGAVVGGESCFCATTCF